MRVIVNKNNKIKKTCLRQLDKDPKCWNEPKMLKWTNSKGALVYLWTMELELRWWNLTNWHELQFKDDKKQNSKQQFFNKNKDG